MLSVRKRNLQDKLRDALLRFSPLRWIHQQETDSGLSPEPDFKLVEAGESRTKPETTLCFVEVAFYT
jgi:hypothetical protein